MSASAAERAGLSFAFVIAMRLPLQGLLEQMPGNERLQMYASMVEAASPAVAAAMLQHLQHEIIKTHTWGIETRRARYQKIGPNFTQYLHVILCCDEMIVLKSNGRIQTVMVQIPSRSFMSLVLFPPPACSSCDSRSLKLVWTSVATSSC